MAWLLRDGTVLAAVEIATTRSDRRRGLLGRDGVEGGILLRPARAVHTLGMRFDLDVAFCTARREQPDQFVVLETRSMRRFRVGRPRWKATCVLEAEAGAFERWGLRAGDLLEIRGVG